MDDVLQRIDEAVKNNPVIIFMKGSPMMPRCGFSMRAAQALQETGMKFAHVDVLADGDVFQSLPAYADWPTFPQVYIGGELIGGCDITLELASSGELKRRCEEAQAAASES